MSPGSTRPGRPPLSMQTEHARQQQLITVAMLLLLLGPLVLAAAALVAVMAGGGRRRLAWCALFGLVGLAGAGLCWRALAELAALAQAAGAEALALTRGRAAGAPPPLREIGLIIWPPLWRWWRADLLLAPLAALILDNNRVQPAEELERERLARERARQGEQERQARAALAKAPAELGGAMVLGAPLGPGDLPWRRGELCVYPADSLARHGAVIGGSGVGKSETVLRIAEGARRAYGWKVFFVDCKGELALAERFAGAMAAAGASRVGRFPARPLDGWRGDPAALLNRLLQVVDYGEPYYRDMTKMLLSLALEAPPGPPRSSGELLERMRLGELRRRYAGRPEADEVDGLRPHDAQAAYNRYRAFFKALGGGLDGGWGFDDVDAGYIMLDGLALKEQTAGLGRYIVEEFAHYVARRKPAGERALLIIDEYPVIAYSGQATASLFEMVRSHGASIFVTGQSYAGMGEGFERILGAAETLILHRTADPERLIARAGDREAFRRRVGFAERGLGRAARDYATGEGSLSVEEEPKIHPNAVKALARGECFVIAGGACQRVLVRRAVGAAAQGPGVASAPPPARPPPGTPFAIPADRPDPEGAPPGAGPEPPPATYADEE